MRRDYRRRNYYNNNRRSYNSYYNPSSVAYDFESERIYYEPRRKQNIEKKKQQKKNKIQIVDEKTVHSVRMYLTAIVVFLFALLIIGSNAVVTEQKSTIAELKDELKQINENNTYLETELTKNIDLTEVEKQATIKLGMQKPAEYQVVYISVPKQSYTTKHANAEAKTEKVEGSGFFKGFKNLMRIE